MLFERRLAPTVMAVRESFRPRNEGLLKLSPFQSARLKEACKIIGALRSSTCEPTGSHGCYSERIFRRC